MRRDSPKIIGEFRVWATGPDGRPAPLIHFPSDALGVLASDSTSGADSSTATVTSASSSSDNADSSAGLDSSTAIVSGVAPAPPIKFGVIQGGGGGGGGGSRSWASVVSIQDWKDRKKNVPPVEVREDSGWVDTHPISIFYNTTVQPTLIYGPEDPGWAPIFFGAAIGWFIAGPKRRFWGVAIGALSTTILVKWISSRKTIERFETVDANRIEEAHGKIPRIVRRRRDLGYFARRSKWQP